MLLQAAGGAQGLHGALAHAGVDAVGLGVAVDHAGCARVPERLWQSLGAAVEQWLRAHSNLHERPHHSHALHLLSSAADFTAMGRYSLAFIPAWAAILLVAVLATCRAPPAVGHAFTSAAALAAATAAHQLLARALPAAAPVLFVAYALVLVLLCLRLRPHPAATLLPSAVLLAPMVLINFSLALLLVLPAAATAILAYAHARTLRVLAAPLLPLLSPPAAAAALLLLLDGYAAAPLLAPHAHYHGIPARLAAWAALPTPAAAARARAMPRGTAAAVHLLAPRTAPARAPAPAPAKAP
jgi:hypothetical protein